MNKNDCFKKIRSRKLLDVKETSNNDEITLTIKLGAKIMKQSQFDILLNILNQLDQKMVDGLKAVHDEVKKIRNTLQKHDKALFKNGLIDEESF